jgi:hypothetical protein
MLKKYFPIICLIAAGLLLFYVKQHQRGNTKQRNTEQTHKNITIPVGPPSPAENQNRAEDFNRRTSHITYTKHARCRMSCRHIDESEVQEILQSGQVNSNKIENDARGKTYPLEGVTHDNQRVRIVFAPKQDGSVVVVTCIDLGTEWPCDCK